MQLLLNGCWVEGEVRVIWPFDGEPCSGPGPIVYKPGREPHPGTFFITMQGVIQCRPDNVIVSLAGRPMDCVIRSHQPTENVLELQGNGSFPFDREEWDAVCRGEIVATK